MTKLNVGDVIEIKTSKGFAYAQYTHEHKRYGSLLRVYSNCYDAPVPIEIINEVVNERPTFSCFFPLKIALKQKIFPIIGNAKVLNENKLFPVFRSVMINPNKGEPNIWWLWDGEKEWRIGALNLEQRKLPIRGIWNDTLLIERIESDWLPETDAII